MEPTSPATLSRPPRSKSTPILNRNLIIRTVISAIHMVIASLSVYSWERSNFGVEESSRTFAVFVILSLTNALCCRSSFRSIFQMGIFSNSILITSLTFSLFILISVFNVPFFAKTFQTHPLFVSEWVRIVLISVTLLIVDELIKWLIVRHRHYKYSTSGNISGNHYKKIIDIV